MEPFGTLSYLSVMYTKSIEEEPERVPKGSVTF